MGMMAWAASCPCVVFCSFHRSPSTSISLWLLLLLLLFWCPASAALPFFAFLTLQDESEFPKLANICIPIGLHRSTSEVFRCADGSPPLVKFKGRENWLREVCRQAGKHSHESQFEGRLWTHLQMDFMNTVQITQVCLLDLLV